MRVAIDISQIVYGTGVSVYTQNLVANLLKIDRENEYVLFGGSLRRKEDILSVFPSAKVFPFPPSLADFIWNKLHILPVEKLIGGIDVVHTSDWTEPPSTAFKVTTVHDLYPFKFPKLVDPKVLAVHRRKMTWVLRESRRIIVPSESTKKDLVNLGAKEEIVRVIPEAPSLKRATEKEIEEAKRKFSIRGDYIISIGLTPLKNTKRIIEAFERAGAGKDLKLVLTGRPSNISVKEQRNVRILGHIESPELGALLSGAKALVFASLYEGYGIPILDAFNCGVPVITSNVASMPEVAGEAAILVDPTDTNSIADGIKKALAGPTGLINKGYARVKDFSWEEAARRTLDVYNESKQ